MNRRELLQLSLMAAITPGGAALGAVSSSTSGKKGLGMGFRSERWQETLRNLNCKWFYSWMHTFPADLPQGVEYIPMIAKDLANPEAIASAGAAAKSAGVNHLLGFNEPDQAKQANMTVERALAMWPLLEKTGLRLGSPACVHPDNEWMQAFMKAAKKQKLRIDFVCVHSYGDDDATKLVNRLEKIRRLYDKPLWITEFAVGDWSAKSAAANRYKPEAVLKFMEDILPKLGRLNFVERYAWFPARQDNPALGTSALFDASGKLTKLGECYRDA
jgi:hypothetical protein